MPEEKLPSETGADQMQHRAEDMMKRTSQFTYVNTSFLSTSNWDTRIIFGERLPSDDIEPRAAVVMPHEQAKAFLEALKRQIENFESTMGEIRYQPLAQSPPNEQNPE
jgi:hypothetical protein